MELGYTFKNPSFLDQALMHPSVLPPGKGIDFERLEFLGDRVLGLVIAHWLYETFPHEPEGKLAQRFVSLVRKETLVEIATQIGLDTVLQAKQEKSSSQQKRLETIVADGCEALIGALFLDGGFEVAQKFIQAAWSRLIQKDVEPQLDPKSELQEWAQGLGKSHPVYVTLKTSGPAHAPTFYVEVQVEGMPSAEGKGTSKKLAESDAATQMLKAITSHE